MTAAKLGLAGVFGRPFVDLEPHLDLSPLAELHDEICLALAQLPVDFTGGSHRSMGIMPEARRGEAHVDYGEVIASLSDPDFVTFASLADNASIALSIGRRANDTELTYGEERDVLLSKRQMLWLKYRFGVYFPWKVYVELIPNRSWEEKSSPVGKGFTARAKTFFPKTIAFVKSLPFAHVGRCNIMGLESNDHGTVHRDGVPAEKPEVDHFVMLCPAANKRFYLFSEQSAEKVHVQKRAFWFNDSDYHGVDADPFFRYSIRIDGVFAPDFLERIR